MAWAGNPRTIGQEERERLAASLAVFGDLSGFVVEWPTLEIICGHQRQGILAEAGDRPIHWSRPHDVQLGFPGRRFTSHERDGWFQTPDGVRWRIRAVEGWAEDFKRAAALTANNQEIAGDWDPAAATALLAQLADEPALDLDAIGLDALQAQLADALAALDAAPKPGNTDPDAIPEPPPEPITRPSDLWRLGDHRLLCGDATKAEDVQRLMGGAAMDCCITSPPYNVGMKYASYRDRAARREYLTFIRSVGDQVFAVLAPGRFVCWNVGVSPSTHAAHHVVQLEEAGFYFQRQIVWAKSGVLYPIFPSTLRTKRARHYKPNYTHEVISILESGADGVQAEITCPLCDGHGKAIAEVQSAEAHEMIHLLTKGEDPELGDPIHPLRRYQNDVWHVAQSMATRDLRTQGTKSTGLEHKGQRAHMLKEHPAAFPVELPQALLGFLTAKGESCLDPFLGSGTTLIACEQLGRRCYGMEIEPRYVDVAVRRWEEFTYRKARLDGRRRGKSRAKAKRES